MQKRNGWLRPLFFLLGKPKTYQIGSISFAPVAMVNKKKKKSGAKPSKSKDKELIIQSRKVPRASSKKSKPRAKIQKGQNRAHDEGKGFFEKGLQQQEEEDQQNKRSYLKLKALLDKESISIVEFGHALKLLRKFRLSLRDLLSFIRNSQMLKERYGKEYRELVADYEAEKLKLSNATSSLEEIQAQEGDLKAKISNLEGLQRLERALAQNNAPLEDLTEYIEEYRKFAQLGFDLGVVKLIAEELKLIQVSPKEAGRVVRSWMEKNRTISEAIFKEESLLEKLKQEESVVLARIKALEQKTVDTQKKIDSLEGYFAKQNSSLQTEYENRERVLRLRATEERTRAEAELLGILKERDKLRGENRTIKEDLDASRSQLELSRAMSVLIRDPKALTMAQLDHLISELTRAKDEKGIILPERVSDARRVLVSALQENSQEL